MATIARRPTSPNPVATIDAMHITASDVDGVDEATNAEIRYYLSAESPFWDAARSVVFSGDFTWDGWIPPAAGDWVVHLRKVSDDSSVANLAFTADSA